MSTLQKIVFAGVECLAQGGGGSPEFYKRMIEIMPDKDRSMFAKLLEPEVPTLTAKFQKMKPYEAWWLTRLVEHLWYPKIRKGELWALCRDGVNDSNVTLARLERNLHNVLDKCVPGWKLVPGYEGEEKVEYYMLGELDVALATFLGRYPNATPPEIDEEAMEERRKAAAIEQEVKQAEEEEYQRWKAAFKETRSWATRPKHRLDDAKSALESARAAERAKAPDGEVGNQGAPAIVEAQEEVKLAEVALQWVEVATRDRQQVQMKRQEDGLPMYAEGEGPARLEAVGDLG